MMPYKTMTKDHLKAVLQGKKKLLKIDQVKHCNAPKFDEIGVKALYDEIVKIPNMKLYFPDSYPAGKQCDRTYMYNVWNTLYPEDVKEVINYANAQRFSELNDRVQQDSILMT